MVRAKKWRAAGVICLLFWASALIGAEVRESDLDAGNDAFLQLSQLNLWAKDVRKAAGLKVPVRLKPPSSVASAEPDIFVGPKTDPRDVAPLSPSVKFNPRVLGSVGPKAGEPPSWVKPEPKRVGVGGEAKVKFGDRKDVSLATIAQNNRAAADAIADAAATVPDFVNPALEEETAEEPLEKTFEQRLEELSEKETPFSLQDYVDFRDFAKENEEQLWELPNRDSRFHENMKTLYRQFADKDANPAAGEALRRLIGVEPQSSSKAGTPKKRLSPAGRTH